MDPARRSDAPVSFGRRLLRVGKILAVLMLVSGASIAFALQVTPEQQVSALGQTVEVGAAAPTLSTSGPGELVLFGESLPTGVDFVGPVRPRLVLTDISITRQVEDLFTPGSSGSVAEELGSELAAGWRRYFAWEILFVSVAAVVLLGAIAGWRRYGARKTVVTIIGGLVVVQLINLSAVMVTAVSAPDVLRRVRSLSELVGREAAQPLPPASGETLDDVEAVVMGDSTAAGLGGPQPRRASPEDAACGRSSIAYANTLARVNGWTVQNLACSGATIDDGILGDQTAGGFDLPPQLAVAKAASDLRAVIVNVGANDMLWSSLVRGCAASDACDNRALTAYFQRNLDAFTQDYFELLRQLTALQGEPTVVITQYYSPFEPDETCVEDVGLTADKVDVLIDRLQTINEVLANGAEIFGFRTARPDLEGHGLCSGQAYVQGFDDPAPFHPNARGQLVIALAVERALLEGSDAVS